MIDLPFAVPGRPAGSALAAATVAAATPDPHAPCARLRCLNGVVVAANAAAGALVGCDPAALVERPFTDWLTRGSVLLWEAQFTPLLAARGAIDGGFLTLRTAAGEELPVLVAATLRAVPGGTCVELALLAARQRVAFEQSLRAARDEAEAARAALAETLERQRATEAQLRQAQKLEAIGQLAGGIAHDFNNLLAVMSGHLELAMLALDPLPGARATGALADLASVREAAERARGVVRQLLAFSRQQVLAPGPLDLNACVRRAERLLPRLLGSAVAWRSELRSDLWPTTADGGQVEQVLLNLALNARDAIHATGRAGTITVATANVVDDAGAAWVRLTVRDTGVGMHAEARARAFEPFFTTKPVGEGSGLGLAMVYGIAHQSGGRVWLESAPGEGTTVVVELPRAVGVAAAAVGAADGPGAPVPEPLASTAAAAPAAPPAARTLLLVEDEAAVRATTRRILERAGYRVLEAEHGGAGLERWRAHRDEIDGVVSDVRMPVLDGRALGAVLRAAAPELPVLLVSGYAEQSVTACGLRDGFLEKPFTASGLLAALDGLGVGPPGRGT